MPTASAQIRASLDHPLIDGDSHIIEYTPVLMDYIKQSGGGDAVLISVRICAVDERVLAGTR